MKYSVDAVPNPYLVFEGFNVDVTRPPFNSPGNEEVDKFYDGGLGCQVLEMADVLFKLGREEEARVSLAAAMDLQKPANPFQPNPFLFQLVMVSILRCS